MANISIKTKYGDIQLGYRLFSKIIIDTLDELDFNIFLSTSKSKPINHSNYKNFIGDDRFFELSQVDESFDVKVYIQINFGTSISQSTEALISSLNENFSKAIGIQPNSISVVITGIKSQNKTSKKHLEVKR